MTVFLAVLFLSTPVHVCVMYRGHCG